MYKDLLWIPQWWKNNNLFFLELGPQALLLVLENILSQNIFLPTTQGPDMKNMFWPHSTDKIYFGRCDTLKIYFGKSIDLQAKYIYNINILPDI